MPVSITSRYRGEPVQLAADASGTTQATVAIRRHQARDSAADHQHVVTGAEDMEYLAWRFYGASETWWRIADANPVAFPLDLRPGARLAVPVDDDAGRSDRARRFG